MNHLYRKATVGLFALGVTLPTFAGVTFGDAKSELGALTVSGAVRANYQDKHYGGPASDQKVQFDAGILKLDYQSSKLFGQVQYRCYQYERLCDFSTLVDGYMGYKINPTDRITLGVQPIPFGPGQYWDSSFYASINNTIGLQDAHNLGVNYHFELDSATQFDLAYFVTDGGNYHGTSRDAARYTANLVKSSDPNKTELQEKNMWMARVKQEFNPQSLPDLKMSVGGSYWYSDIENNRTSAQGSRDAWALFNTLNYKNFALSITGGEMSLDNKDGMNPNQSTFGSFDTEYDIANDGYFYTVDMNYTFANVGDMVNITPYFVYSGFNKKQRGFADSERHIAGVAWNHNNVSLYTEYVMSKNDPFVGGTSSSLAQGDDGKMNKLLNLMFIYSF
ncbi:hypothetical protein F4T82_08630 [Acinetobacter lwoffii]|uniref:hypothetical protein n=1 Tax=Acinetobacter lwoffii TaxID=28090 RepID=UPI0012987601|nr:hypothetical protein [Acinetobacter lwoffii]MRA03803.1 hypothetical protein [Acinetobacter lwoffii]